MIKLLREIATDSLDVSKLAYKQWKMKGSGKAAVAARKRMEAERILHVAKEKAQSEEAILLETRNKALLELAGLQAKAFEKGLNPLKSAFDAAPDTHPDKKFTK